MYKVIAAANLTELPFRLIALGPPGTACGILEQ